MTKIKGFAIVGATFLLLACSGGADDSIYEEYHSLVCKTAKLQVTPSDVARLAELSEELQKFARDTDHLKKLAAAMDISDC
jgi:hypothetical protein